MLFNNTFLCIWGNILGFMGKFFKISIFNILTSQKQDMTELKLIWPVNMTGHCSKIILSPVCGFHDETKMGPFLFSLKLVLLQNIVLYYHRFPSAIWLDLFFNKKSFWLNHHLHPFKTRISPLTTDLHLLALFSWQMKNAWCCSVPAIPVLVEAAETIWCLVNEVSKYIWKAEGKNVP